MRDTDARSINNDSRQADNAPVWPTVAVPEETAPDSTADLERLRDEISEQFDRREQELNRRERSLGEQLAALDRERRSSRLADKATGQKLQQRESALAAKESELALRLTRCEELIAELEEEQAALDAERAGLSQQKQAIRESVLAELAGDRQAIDAEREALYNEKREFRKRVEQHEQEAASIRDELRQSWEIERETLRQQLTAKIAAELIADRQAFDDERTAWEDRRREELAAFEQERAEHDRVLDRARSDLERLRREQEIEFARRRRDLESEIESQVRSAEAALHEQQAEWESARAAAETELRELRIDLDRRRSADEASLARAREEFEAERKEQLAAIAAESADRQAAYEAERAEFLAERDATSERLAAESAALEEARRAFEAEQQERRERVTAELAELRQEHERTLSEQQSQWRRACETDRLAIDEERAVMENRLHFQREHLDRTRLDLEQTRNELELRLQQGRHQAAMLGEQHRLRQSQLLRFRRLLDERETVIDRERALLADLQRQAEEERIRAASHGEAAAAAWLREKEAEQHALEQLREDLAARGDQIAARQARLDTLRIELETTHRENLELRVALDETWIKLVQAAGPDEARQQLQANRLLVAEHFREKEAELDQRRAQAQNETAGARKLIDQLDVRRRELSDWLAQSLTTLHRREEELKRWAAAINARESRSAANLRHWREQRSEAEGVIRGLLRQLSDATASELASPSRLSSDADTDDRDRTAVDPPQATLNGPHARTLSPVPSEPVPSESTVPFDEEHSADEA